MKAFAAVCALIAIALAVTLGINRHTDASDNAEQEQALQATRSQVQHLRQELQQAQNAAHEQQAELDTIRTLLAEAKTNESGLKLQLTESELKIRELSEQLTQSKLVYQVLEKQHRELKKELVQLHTSSNPAEVSHNRLSQYEQEIADLQRQLRELQQPK